MVRYGPAPARPVQEAVGGAGPHGTPELEGQRRRHARAVHEVCGVLRAPYTPGDGGGGCGGGGLHPWKSLVPVTITVGSCDPENEIV